MKKQIISISAAICILVTLTGIRPVASAVSGARLSNFTTGKAVYTAGQFSDVDEHAWYGTENQGTIKKAVELGIMNGTGRASFNPTDSITIGQAVKMAAVVHSIYCNDGTKFTQGDPWYKVYTDYAIENGIISASDFSDYGMNITHAQMSHIFSNAVEKSALAKINTVDSLPDVDAGTKYSADIFLLYRAGVLMGSDAYGSFYPNANIQRCEATAIIVRIASVGERKALSLKPAASKIYSGKDPVYDQYAKDGSYTDSCGNKDDFSYHVPAINIDSDAAAAINSEIQAYCMSYINGDLSNMSSGCSIEFNKISYYYYVNDNILSLIIKVNYLDDDYIEYKTYNISTYTGNTVNGSNLLEYKNVIPQKLLNTVKEKAEIEFDQAVSGLDPAYYQDVHARTISSDNISMNMPMFMDQNGNINVVTKIYTIAGGGMYETIINTGL